ncbi:MAG: SPOR domain-containing protein [Bacteroidaceae bacterium]
MRISFVLLILFSLCPALAQQRYTDLIQKSVPGQGRITLYQSEKITALVNGTSPAKAAPLSSKQIVSPSSSTNRQQPDTVDTVSASIKTAGQKMRVNGYRIQVYSGDNSRKGKTEATSMGHRVKDMFPELTVYTNFASPHWICRVGDFRTYEEANEYFQQMKDSGQFAEAVMVRCKVTVYY